MGRPPTAGKWHTTLPHPQPILRGTSDSGLSLSRCNSPLLGLSLD